MYHPAMIDWFHCFAGFTDATDVNNLPSLFGNSDAVISSVQMGEISFAAQSIIRSLPSHPTLCTSSAQQQALKFVLEQVPNRFEKKWVNELRDFVNDADR